MTRDKRWPVLEVDGRWVVGDLTTNIWFKSFIFREDAERFCGRRNNPNEIFLRPW